MIVFEHIFLQYVNEFYSLYDFNYEINSHTLFVGDFFDGTNAIMRTLSKIDKDYQGEIFIDNINLRNIKDKELNLVYLPENPILFKNKNVFKNLYFPLKIRKINKNIANNLIYNTFLELKNKNFDFLANYLNIKNTSWNNKNNLRNNGFEKHLIDNILKLKVKNLNLSEQKIITLIRALIRKPKYILLENFFEDLDKEDISIAKFLIEKLKETSTIIACEKTKTQLKHFKDFKVINFSENK